MFSRSFLRWAAVVSLAAAIFVPAIMSQDEATRKVKSRVEPEYPAIAKRLRLSGTVKIQVTVTPSGSVKSTKVIGGHPVLVESSVSAVKKWKFEPAHDETVQTVVFKFEQ